MGAQSEATGLSAVVCKPWQWLEKHRPEWVAHSTYGEHRPDNTELQKQKHQQHVNMVASSPVDCEITFEPKAVFTVVVIETAILRAKARRDLFLCERATKYVIHLAPLQHF